MSALYSLVALPLASSKEMNDDHRLCAHDRNPGVLHHRGDRHVDGQLTSNSYHLPRFAGCTPADLYSTCGRCIRPVMPSHGVASAVQVAQATEEIHGAQQASAGIQRRMCHHGLTRSASPNRSDNNQAGRISAPRRTIQPFTSGTQPVSTGVRFSDRVLAPAHHRIGVDGQAAFMVSGDRVSFMQRHTSADVSRP